VEFVKYIQGFSTTDIIEKIIKSEKKSWQITVPDLGCQF
jgi:hypothetical protein